MKLRSLLFRNSGSTILATEVALVAILAALSVVSPIGSATQSARPLFSPGLRVGSSGKQVRAAQFILSGDDRHVNRYARTIHPFRGRKVTGQFGKHTAEAVLKTRWLLGEPIGYRKACRCRPGKRAVFDRDLYLILSGRKARPLGWFGTASKRMALADRTKPSRASSTCTRRIVGTAESQVGVHEIPWGSNDGPTVRIYQSATGAYRAAWCASFVQWDLRVAGVGTIADRSAGVYYIVDWARRNTWLRSTPAAGALVAYVSYTGRIRVVSGHIGIVERVTRDGFWTIEGNSSNAVTRHFRRFGDATVFIYPPCLA